MTVTVCLPWRATPDRVPAFDRCTRYWEQRGHTVICADSNPDRRFNRAQARNNAVTQAAGDVVILADADTLPDNYDRIRQAIRAAADYAAVWPYKKYRLLPGDAVTVEDLTDVTPVREFPVRWRPGGLTVIHRRAYWEIGGYDETFGPGWGCEDGAFHMVCQTLLPTQHLPGVAYAFDHAGSRARDHRNRRRFWWYQRALNKPDQMRHLIKPRVGGDAA